MGLGQGLRLIPDLSVTFWPPSGIFVAALLLSARRTWPYWIVAAFVAEMLGNLLWFHNPPVPAALYFTGNAAEALTAATLVRRVLVRRSSVFSPRLLRFPGNAAVFALLAAGIAPVVGATIIASIDAVTGKHEFWATWFMVWLGDGTGLLLSAPVALGAIAILRGRWRLPASTLLEVAGLCALASVLTWVAVDGRPTWLYLTLPVLVWCAVRFQIPGAWAALSTVILTTAVCARPGAGWLAAPGVNTHEKMVALQAFLGVSAAASLLVAGLSARHVRTRDRLRSANARLERRVLERTRELHAAGEQLRLALNVGRSAAFVWDVATDTVRIVHDGIHAPSAGGVSPPLPPPRNLAQVLSAVHPEDREDLHGRVRRALAEPGETYTSEYRRTGPDGSVRWIRDLGKVEFDADGRPLRLIGLAIDITDRRLAEQQLRESEHRLRLCMAAAQTGMWEWDVSTDQVRWSPECYAIVGHEHGAFDGTAAGFNALVHPDDAARVWTTVRSAVESMTLYECEFRIRRPDGQVRWVANVGRAIRVAVGEDAAAGSGARAGGGGAAGGHVRMIGTVTDVTERRQMVEALRAHRDNLQQLVDARTSELLKAHARAATQERMAAVGTLAAGLAHDMNNLLLPLGMQLDLLNSGGPLSPGRVPPAIPPEVKEELAVLSSLLGHLRALAHNLSLFTRDPSKEGIQGRAKLADWCAQVSKLIHASVGSGINVTWDCAPTLPEAAIAPHRLTQAVQNLVHNARDAILSRRSAGEAAGGRDGVVLGCPVGTIAVAARQGEGEQFIELSVTDDGSGMSEEVLRHCREPFYTTKDRPASAGTPSGGSGLGLSLAHQIVEGVGGEMLIDSTLGQGTTITLRIPVAPPLPPATIESKGTPSLRMT